MDRKKLLPLILSLISLLPVLTGTAFGSIIPTIKNYFELENIQISIIIATSTMVMILVSPLIGKLSDKLQPNKIIIILLAFYLVGAVANSLSILFGNFGYYMLIIGRFFQGIGNIGAGPLAISLVKNLSEERNSNKNIATIEAYTSTGAVFGPIIGGIFAVSQWNWLFLFDLSLMFLFIVILFILLQSITEIPPIIISGSKIGVKKQNKNGQKLSAYLGGFGLMFSLIGLQAFLVDYFTAEYQISVIFAGAIVSSHALLMALTAGFSGKYLNGRISGKLISIGLGVFGLAMIFVGLEIALVPTSMVIVLSGCGCGLILPSGNVLIIENTEQKQQSFAVSLFASSRSLGVLFGSFILGAVSTYYGYQSMFLISGIILFAIFFYSIYALTRSGK